MSTVFERGDRFFLYRPRVDTDEFDELRIFAVMTDELIKDFRIGFKGVRRRNEIAADENYSKK